MTILYQSQFCQIGQFAADALADNLLITFKHPVPEDLADYCFILEHQQVPATFQVGDVLEIGGTAYPITAVGEVANVNFQQLGHISCSFDGRHQASYPGTVHLAGTVPTAVKNGEIFKITRP